MQWFCQCLMILHLLAGFVATLRVDVVGRERIQPSGWNGVVGTLILYVVLVIVWFCAGCFDALI